MRKLTKDTKQKVKAEYDRLVLKMLVTENLEELNVLKQRCQMCSEILETRWKVSPDTIAIVSANLVGILLILYYEKLDVVSSKAIGFVLKGRV